MLLSTAVWTGEAVYSLMSGTSQSGGFGCWQPLDARFRRSQLNQRRLMAQALSRQWGWKEEAAPPCPTFSAMCTSELTSWVCSNRAGRVNGAEPEALINSVAVAGGGDGDFPRSHLQHPGAPCL